MLEKAGCWYDDELTEKVKRLSSVLEPLLILFVGAIVGFMALAVFLPVTSAVQSYL